MDLSSDIWMRIYGVRQFAVWLAADKASVIGRRLTWGFGYG